MEPILKDHLSNLGGRDLKSLVLSLLLIDIGVTNLRKRIPRLVSSKGFLAVAVGLENSLGAFGKGIPSFIKIIRIRILLNIKQSFRKEIRTDGVSNVLKHSHLLELLFLSRCLTSVNHGGQKHRSLSLGFFIDILPIQKTVRIQACFLSIVSGVIETGACDVESCKLVSVKRSFRLCSFENRGNSLLILELLVREAGSRAKTNITKL